MIITLEDIKALATTAKMSGKEGHVLDIAIEYIEHLEERLEKLMDELVKSSNK